MTLTKPVPPLRRKVPAALTTAAGLAALLGTAALNPSSAHALSGTAAIAPGTTYNAPVGTNFSLDFSGVFTDPAMNGGSYWEFNIVELTGNANFTNLGWQISSDNGTTWSPVDWQGLDPMGTPSTATTTPTRDGSGNFTASSNTITLGLGSPGTSLTSAYLPKSSFSGLTNVRMVGDVNAASTPYKTKFSISDVIWDGGPNTPVDNNAYQANLAYEVPGPLPVMGAAVALGFSRRLRRRVSKTAG
jgi:hypothetical protein